MSEPEEHTYWEYKDDQLRGPEPSEPPEEQPLDLDGIESLFNSLPPFGTTTSDKAHLISLIPHLVAELRQAREELEDWQGRERRIEYGLASKSPDIRVLQISRAVAERAWANPEVGPPLERTVTTSEWSEMVLPPF